jgi:hypothetical protein
MLSRPTPAAPRHRLLTVAILGLLLAVIVAANALAVTRLPRPTTPPPPAAPAIAILRPTTTATAGYLPTPAGPPATTPDGHLTTQPAPASPSTGGGR